MVQMKNWDPLVSRPALAMAAESAWAAFKRASQLTEDTGTSVLELEVLIGELVRQNLPEVSRSVTHLVSVD